MSFIKTKTIATLGPISKSPSIITELIDEGVDVFRINMSHFKNDVDFENTVKIIRKESKSKNKYIGILVDLAGPKIRIDLNKEENSIKINKNQKYTLGYSNTNDITINEKIDFKNISFKDAFVKIDDGKIVFEVLSKSHSGHCASPYYPNRLKG